MSIQGIKMYHLEKCDNELFLFVCNPLFPPTSLSPWLSVCPFNTLIFIRIEMESDV